MPVFPVEILPRGDRRRAVVSSRFSRDGAREGRVHLGADIVFRRRSRAAFGEDSPIDPDDNDTPNDPRAGAGFPRFFVPPGVRVLATEKGRVLRAGRIKSGLRVQIQHEASPLDGANATLYLHLDSLQVAAGDTVRAGQFIGTIGAGELGRGGAGRHLHFERRQRASVGRVGRAVDPEPYLRTCQHRAGRLFPPSVAGALATMATVLASVAWPWFPSASEPNA